MVAWRECRPASDLDVSQVVLEEILAGDTDAAEPGSHDMAAFVTDPG
jgi:hypothetical protein